MIKFVKSSRDSWLELAGGLRLASRQMMHTSETCGKDEQSRQLKHYRTKIPVWQFCLLTSWTRDSVKSRGQVASQLFVLKNLTLRIPLSLQYKYPSYPWNIESFEREYWERNPREKQDSLIHNLHILERFIIKIFSHHTHICEKAIWCLGSS